MIVFGECTEVNPEGHLYGFFYSSHKGGVIEGLVGSLIPHHKGVVIHPLSCGLPEALQAALWPPAHL